MNQVKEINKATAKEGSVAATDVINVDYHQSSSKIVTTYLERSQELTILTKKLVSYFNLHTLHINKCFTN